MADLDTAPKQDLEGNDTNAVETMKSHFLEHSQIKSSGIREVNKAGFDAALLTQGVTGQDVKRVQAAVDAATTAATALAADDLENKIKEATPDQLGDDNYRRGLSSTVRLPTHGGKTEATVSAETVNNIPFRGDADGNGERQTKTTYGRVRVSINATGRIAKDLPGTISDRMRAALGIDAA